MDRKECVSDGRGGVRGCGAGAAGEKRLGCRRRGGAGAAGPPRPCASRKRVPAHASKPKGVSEGRAAAKAAQMAARAATSVPPLGGGQRDGRASVGGTGAGAGDAPCATIKRRSTRGRDACKKQGVRGKNGATQGRSVRVRGVLVRRDGGTMRVAWGRGAAHGVEEDNGSAGKTTTAGALREAIPPPCRHGESNPEPCRPSGRQGGPANGFFRSAREPHHLLRRRRACRFSAAICSLLALQHAWQREVGEYAVHGACKTDGVEEADAACAKH